MNKKEITGILADAPVIIRRYGRYVNKVKGINDLEDFLGANLPEGVFRKTEANPDFGRPTMSFELLPLSQSGNVCRGRWRENGEEIPLGLLARGLGYTFSLEMGVEID